MEEFFKALKGRRQAFWVVPDVEKMTLHVFCDQQDAEEIADAAGVRCWKVNPVEVHDLAWCELDSSGESLDTIEAPVYPTVEVQHG